MSKELQIKNDTLTIDVVNEAMEMVNKDTLAKGIWWALAELEDVITNGIKVGFAQSVIENNGSYWLAVNIDIAPETKDAFPFIRIMDADRLNEWIANNEAFTDNKKYADRLTDKVTLENIEYDGKTQIKLYFKKG